MSACSVQLMKIMVAFVNIFYEKVKFLEPKKYLINTIYPAIEGEGVRLGTPQIFIRFQGCSIGCVNCDSKETWDYSADKAMELADILQKVENLAQAQRNKIKWISITGGDPLSPYHEENVIKLVSALKMLDYKINIEAAGTRVVKSIFDQVDFISFDVKTPSTRVKTSVKLLAEVIENYTQKLQIKAVIADQKDFDYCLSFQEKTTELTDKVPLVSWVLTPCIETGNSADMNLFKMIYDLNFKNGCLFKVIGQQHKWVYGSSEKNV